MTTRRVAVAFAAALAASACAPKRTSGPHLDRAAKMEAAPYRGQAATLPSGLRAVAYELAGAPSASVSVAYGVADLPEPEGKEGLRILVARLMDRNAPGRGGLQIMERHFASGAIWDSDTYLTQLRLDVRFRPDRLGEVLATESDRLREPASALEDPTITWMKENLAREYEEAEPGAEALSVLIARALPGSPHSRRYPTAASVRAITPEDVRTYLRGALRPERATVAVIGPFPAARALQAVVAAFGEGDPAKPIQPSAPPPAPRLDGPVARSAEVVKGHRKHAELWLAWAVPGIGAQQTANALAAARLLQVAAWARSYGDLYKDVRWVRGDTYLSEGASFVLLKVGLERKADVERVRLAMVDAVTEVREDWGRRHVLSVTDLGMDLTFGAFNRLEKGEISNVHELYRAGQADALAAWTREAGTMPAQIQGYLETWIRADRVAAVHLTAADGPERPAEPAELEKELTRAPSVLGAAAPGAAETPRLLRPPGLAGGERRTLPNGMRVVVLPRNAFPTVQVSLVVATDTETPLARAEKAVVLVTSRHWLEGCAAPEAVLGAGEVQISLRGPAARLPQFLDRVACWTKAGSNRWKVDSALQALRDFERRPEARASFVLGTIRRALGDPGPAQLAPVFSELDRADAAKRFGRWFRPDRATLVIAGKVSDAEAALNEVFDAFGGWENDGPALVEPAAPTPAARRFLLLDYPGSPTGFAFAMYRLPPQGARDEAAFEVLQSHLVERVRQLASPAKATPYVAVLDGTHLTYGSVGLSGKRELLPAAVKELLLDLDALASRPLDSPALDFARWNAARSLAYAWDDLAPVTATVGRLSVRGLPRDAYEHLGAALGAVTPGSLQATAAAVFGKELVVVAGDAAVLGPALKQLGYAPEVLRVSEKKDDTASGEEE